MIDSESTSDKSKKADIPGFERQRMVDWFSPTQLTQTGLRAVISGVFGNYADKREIQAALTDSQESLKPFDFSEREELWLDYVSDLGSGWNSTYSVAYLLGRKELEVADRQGNRHRLRRGNILVMGGDEVYPTATAEEYRNRLVGPYRSSLSYVDDQDDPPTLFAIPGNHDWYDGLSSFIKLFCQQRWIGGWKTRQTRSYFAARLPYNWWLWGIDIQLSADVDKPQLDYFDEMYRLAAPDDRIILCTAEPAWVYQEYQPDDKPYRNLKFFTDRYSEKKKEKKLDFRLMITGDMHHYVSFRNDGKADPDWKITAGGGGAFMHPTHHVPDVLNLEEGRYVKNAAYPDSKDSRRLALNNLRFPFINLSFGALFAAVYLLFGWFIGTSSESGSFLFVLAELGWSELGQVCRSYGSLLLASPGLTIFLALLFVGLLAFSDTNRKKPFGSWIAGILHGAAQVILLLSAVWLTSYLILGVGAYDADSLAGIALGALLLALCGWLLSGFTIGLYLMTVTLLFSTHETEAFSSFRGEDYKNFLRMRLNRDGLTIYPVKVPAACRRWRSAETMVEGEEPWYKPDSDGDLNYGLIEDSIIISTPKSN